MENADVQNQGISGTDVLSSSCPFWFLSTIRDWEMKRIVLCSFTRVKVFLGCVGVGFINRSDGWAHLCYSQTLSCACSLVNANCHFPNSSEKATKGIILCVWSSKKPNEVISGLMCCPCLVRTKSAVSLLHLVPKILPRSHFPVSVWFSFHGW